MALAFDIPTLGFSTLEVVGFGASKKYGVNKIAIALDARMGEVYWAKYENGKFNSEAIFKPDEAPKLNNDYLGVGTGWGVYQQELASATGINRHYDEFYPKAENLIDLALIHIKNNKPLDDNLPLPTYLRNNVAKKSLK
jgi:tRNA threonylcarbamoyladenosine biosynthesis protein TsaB